MLHRRPLDACTELLPAVPRWLATLLVLSGLSGCALQARDHS
jgi:hypothetical protein